eukprot:CCRYP_006452-RA/>CCRYP_006452-RA protein AED:0.46 eAED:0.46 QI:0/-1/0/1/-1/1/1/0/174
MKVSCQIFVAALTAFLHVGGATDEMPSSYFKASKADFSMDYNILSNFSGKTGKGSFGKSAKGGSKVGKSGKGSSDQAGKGALMINTSSESGGMPSDAEKSGELNAYYDLNGREHQYVTDYPTSSPTESLPRTNAPVSDFKPCPFFDQCCTNLASNAKPSRWCRKNGCSAAVCRV